MLKNTKNQQKNGWFLVFHSCKPYLKGMFLDNSLISYARIVQTLDNKSIRQLACHVSPTCYAFPASQHAMLFQHAHHLLPDAVVSTESKHCEEI